MDKTRNQALEWCRLNKVDFGKLENPPHGWSWVDNNEFVNCDETNHYLFASAIYDDIFRQDAEDYCLAYRTAIKSGETPAMARSLALNDYEPAAHIY